MAWRDLAKRAERHRFDFTAVVLYALLRQARLRPRFVLASSQGPRLPELAAPLLACPQRDLFDSDALALLHESSGGRLRDIDRIATAGRVRAALMAGNPDTNNADSTTHASGIA